jgi:hypothetical protein
MHQHFKRMSLWLLSEPASIKPWIHHIVINRTKTVIDPKVHIESVGSWILYGIGQDIIIIKIGAAYVRKNALGDIISKIGIKR